MEEEITEIDFISCCPAEQCINKNKLYRWLHYNCGGKRKISREGMVRCSKCGERAKFIEMDCNCGEHKSESLSDQKVEYFLLYMDRLNLNYERLNIFFENKDNFLEELTIVIMSQFIKKKEERRSGVPGNNLDGKESQQEITEIDFIAPCPVQDCMNKNQCYTWLHSICKGRLKLNNKGMLRCLNCGTQGSFVDWPFNCGDHGDKKCSARGFAHSFGVMAQQASAQGVEHSLGGIAQQIYDKRKQAIVAERKVFIAATSIMLQITDKKREAKIIKDCAISEEYNNLQLKIYEQKSFQEQSKHKSKEEISEFELISPCPVQECVTRNTLYKWKHKKCNGKLTLNIKGMVRCHECGTQVKYVDWPFNCGVHNGKKTCSLVGATHALEVASQFEANKNHKELIKKVLQVIMNDTFEDTKLEAIGEKVSYHEKLPSIIPFPVRYSRSTS